MPANEPTPLSAEEEGRIRQTCAPSIVVVGKVKTTLRRLFATLDAERAARAEAERQRDAATLAGVRAGIEACAADAKVLFEQAAKMGVAKSVLPPESLVFQETFLGIARVAAEAMQELVLSLDAEAIAREAKP